MINTNTLIWIIIAWLMIIFFAGIEIAFANANRLTIEIKKKQGLQRSILLSGFLNNPSRFISALLIGFNLFLVIFGSAGGRNPVSVMGIYYQENDCTPGMGGYFSSDV